MATIQGRRQSRYTPGNPPSGDRWLREELERIADAMQSPVAMLTLDILHAAPDRLPADRVPIVYADGTDWNPGAGAGVYAYHSGAWNKLG
jgi:hypothetical protein